MTRTIEQWIEHISSELEKEQKKIDTMKIQLNLLTEMREFNVKSNQLTTNN